MIRNVLRAPILALAMLAIGMGMGAASARAATAERVTVTGELIDTWCYATGMMYALGTAHHKCAIWCAVGGIPVSIRDADGNIYVVLRIGEDDRSVANPGLVTIQTHQVVVNGDLIVRDGVNYLFVSEVADDQGIINLSHEEHGVVPF